jgi:hypothetical protein
MSYVRIIALPAARWRQAVVQSTAARERNSRA